MSVPQYTVSFIFNDKFGDVTKLSMFIVSGCICSECNVGCLSRFLCMSEHDDLTRVSTLMCLFYKWTRCLCTLKKIQSCISSNR